MRTSWAIRSLNDGIRLDESEYQTEGTVTKPDADGVNIAKDHESSRTQETRMSVEELIPLFRKQMKRHAGGGIGLFRIACELDTEVC